MGIILKRKTMRIKDLKEEHPAIYDLAIKRMDQGFTEDDLIDTAFSWDPTPEKHAFWQSINQGNFQVFYGRYPEYAKDPIKFSQPTTQEEPKAGDMVRACDVSQVWEYAYFTGGKTRSGHFICELESPNHIIYATDIRLPQKSEVESKAKELLNNTTFISSDASNNKTYLEQYLIEYGENCIKWGQQNPNAK